MLSLIENKTALNFTILIIISFFILISVTFDAYAQKNNNMKEIQLKNLTKSTYFN